MLDTTMDDGQTFGWSTVNDGHRTMVSQSDGQRTTVDARMVNDR